MRNLFLGAVLGLSFVVAVPALGQGIAVDVGPRLGFDVAGDIEELFLGADARLDFPELPIVINPTFDYYFVDGFDFYQFSMNALLDITSGAMPNISPYVGAGLGIAKLSVDEVDTPFGSAGGSSSDIGINLIGGGSINAGGFKPFAQLQLTLAGDVNLITIALGALFSIGG